MGMALPTTGRIAVLDGVQLYYEVYGSGEPLVLLHGFMGSSLDWAALAAESAGHFQVIVPDMRGHGRSTNPASTFRHDAAADDILALMDRLGVCTFKGLGVSAGANVLLHLATRHPARVKGMVLVSATTHFPDQARAIMRSYVYYPRVTPPGSPLVDLRKNRTFKNVNLMILKNNIGFVCPIFAFRPPHSSDAQTCTMCTFSSAGGRKVLSSPQERKARNTSAESTQSCESG
jgi:pimeloyl-ACP methyl ester carboxylesterase